MNNQELLDKIYENKEQRIDILSRKNTTEFLDVQKLIYETRKNPFFKENDFIYENDLPQIPKGIRKQTRQLKQEARKILDLSNEEIDKLFRIKKLKSKEKLTQSQFKTIEFNEIKSEGEVYTGDLNDYQIEILDKLFDFDWGEKLQITGDKLDNPTYRNMYLKKKPEENTLGSFIQITNTYNGLDYSQKDIPKNGTELFLISKLIQERIKKLKDLKAYMKHNSIILEYILNRQDDNIQQIKISDEQIYNGLYDTIIWDDLTYYYNELIEYLYNIEQICNIIKEKYPEFQMPINFDEEGYKSEEYKKGVVFENFKQLRKEY